MNQCWLRHSVLNRPLNASMNCCPSAFPGARSPERRRGDRPRGPCRATRTQCPGPREWSWDSHLPADPVECRYHILAAVAVAHVQHGHVARVGVHDGQHAELLARHQLAMHEVHCPHIVESDRFDSIITQLCLYPPLRRLVPELHAQLPVNAVDFLDVDAPALAVQKHVNPAIAVTNTRFADLLDPLLHGSLIGAAGFVVERRTVESDGATRRPDRDRPIAAHPANQFAHPTRLQIFRRMTSCNISRSSVRSATTFFNRPFSSSSCFSRIISVGNKPAYFFLQLK